MPRMWQVPHLEMHVESRRIVRTRAASSRHGSDWSNNIDLFPVPKGNMVRGHQWDMPPRQLGSNIILNRCYLASVPSVTRLKPRDQDATMMDWKTR